MKNKRKMKIATLNIPLADPGRSNYSNKLRRDNEILLKRLEAAKPGSLGISRWLNKKGKRRGRKQ